MSALERLGISQQHTLYSQDLSDNQEQTKRTFAYKWSKTDSYESEKFIEKARAWMLEKYCENDSTRIDTWLAGGRKIILDAGCGVGLSGLVFFNDHLINHDYLGVDISDSIHIAKKRFQRQGYPADFLQSNLMSLPIPDQSIDIIFSEGVLHHTDSTQNAIHALAKKLKPNGRFLFYVYAKKAVIREFTDDFIRDQLLSLSDDEAWNVLEPLSKLGKALGELQTEITIPQDIPLLGIKQGRMDIQRFFYWYVCKAFYNPDFSLEEMNHINFDWFRPLNCHRHTPEEVASYCLEAGLEVENMNIQESGITTVARKVDH